MDTEKIKACAITAGITAIFVPIALVWSGYLHTATSVESAATAATNELAATYCTRDFMAAEDAEASLAELKATTSSLARSRMVRESGFSIPPNTTRENRAVTDLCAQKLFAS